MCNHLRANECSLWSTMDGGPAIVLAEHLADNGGKAPIR